MMVIEIHKQGHRIDLVFFALGPQVIDLILRKVRKEVLECPYPKSSQGNLGLGMESWEGIQI